MPMTLEKVKRQIHKAKRLADLKSEREKDDPLPIINFSYGINNSSKIATMRVTRNEHPLNYRTFNNFILKNLKAKFQWVATTAGKLEIPPIPQLMPYEISPAEKERKRKAKVLHEVFVKENIMVDGMKRNLVPPVGVVGSVRLVIKELEAGIFIYNGSFDLCEKLPRTQSGRDIGNQAKTSRQGRHAASVSEDDGAQNVPPLPPPFNPPVREPVVQEKGMETRCNTPKIRITAEGVLQIGIRSAGYRELAYHRGKGVVKNVMGQLDVRVELRVEDVFQVMAHLEQHVVIVGNMNQASTYKDICYCKPPDFEGIVDLIISTKWIKGVESVFRTSKCSNGDLVSFASSHLRDRARHWWDVIVDDIKYRLFYSIIYPM
ncbi:hypothetical protein Tco_0318765 [Tanacetum coccineum]